MRRIVILLLCVGWHFHAWATNRIMLIGDSITQGVGSSDGLGFRDELAQRLDVMGYPYSYVGIFGGEPYPGHFRQGATIGQFYTGPGGEGGSLDVGYDMDVNDPNIVIIHLGTNDAFMYRAMAPYTTSETAAWRMRYLIEYLIRWHNGNRSDQLRTILICQIIPNTSYPDRVDELNDGLAQFVQDANNGLISPIPPGILRLVDQHTSFVPETMLDSDGVHPNDVGYQHMTDVFEDAFYYLPMYLERVTEEEVSGAMGCELSEPLTVRVTDKHGNGVAYVDVTFQVTEGDALLLDSQPVQTDDLGLARGRLQLGGQGVSTVTAMSPGLIESETNFRVTASNYVKIEGTITYYANDMPVPDVQMKWVEQGSFVGATNSAGSYLIDDFEFGNRVTLQPWKNPPATASASPILSYDAALTARHAVGLVSLLPEKQVAADVDGDQAVTMNDAAHIARYAVGITVPTYTHVGEWTFAPHQLYYDYLSCDQTGQNMTGMMMGDLHGGWTPPSVPKPDITGRWTLSMSMERTGPSDVSVYVNVGRGDMLSADCVCRYDPRTLELTAISQTERTQSFQLHCHEGERGTVRIGLFSPAPTSGEDAIISFRFRIKNKTDPAFLQVQDMYVNDDFLGNTTLNLTETCEQVQAEAVSPVQCYPNPFNDRTMIRFQVPETSGVHLHIYDSRGREVASLIDEEKSQGIYQIPWNGRDKEGRIVPSGVYFYRLSTSRGEHTRKMIKAR